MQPNNLPISVLIVSDVRFLRESLAEVLQREGTLAISGAFASWQEALLDFANKQPDIIVIDEALPGGLAAVRRIRGVSPQIPIVVIAVAEIAEEIIAWAEAGVSGYIPRTASLADMVSLLVDIRRGKQVCSATVAAGLLRRISDGVTPNGGHHYATPPLPLTDREAQIAQMIAAGMSNKDIARRLNIGMATVKTHVHHLLGKLKLQSRGQAASWIRENYHRHRDL